MHNTLCDAEMQAAVATVRLDVCRRCASHATDQRPLSGSGRGGQGL